MITSLLALALPLKPVDFPSAPLAAEVDKGVRTYSLGKGLERLYMDDRQVVGVWFDGRLHRDADHVVWISPSLMSRWLGYLDAKEKWPAGELEKRWGFLRKSLGGRMTFIVRLCALPKIDILEQEVALPADPCDMTKVRFLWTSNRSELSAVQDRELIHVPGAVERLPAFGKRVPIGLNSDPSVYLVSEHRADTANKVFQEDWWMRVPFGESIQPEFAKECMEEMAFCGEYHSRTYFVSLPIPEEPIEANRFELRIFSPRKERVAKFSLFSKK